MAASQSNASKAFSCRVVLGSVEDSRFCRELGHSFLRERGTDDMAGQVFHGLFFPGIDAGGAAKDLKTRMPSGL
jgi:hypothetical protein